MDTGERKTELEQKTEELWKVLEARQGETFYTAKKLPFQYTIRGGEMFVDRRSRSITRSTFANALKKIGERSEEVRGPKSLNVFGAPYVWALLVTLGIVDGTPADECGEQPPKPDRRRRRKRAGGTPSKDGSEQISSE